MSEALAGVDLSALRFEGTRLRADVTAAITAADVERTIEGASTLTVALRDTHRTLVKSGIFSSRITAQVDRFSFELVQVKKGGHALTATFEDLAVAALRRHTKPRKIGPGRMTRVEFAKSLVAEEPWIKFVAPVAGARTKVELARGKVAVAGEAAEKEDTWTALGRLADEVGWRRFVRDGAIWFLPETHLFKGKPQYVLVEGRDGVDNIDWDFDIGKPVATVTVVARAERWKVPPGTLVEVRNQGPATGKWIVQKITRSLFSTAVTVTLVKPRPTLPEPVPAPPPPVERGAVDPPGSGPAGVLPSGSGSPFAPGTGTKVNTGAASDYGYAWPVRGTITSPFGPRGGNLHAGLDIAVPVGTPVGASKEGTVTFAGTQGGYGNVVYINHGGTFTRYGHLSRIEVRRGQQVARGERIGLSGGAKGAPGAGTSTGPHLHFEIRPGDRPANPRNYLPGGAAERRGLLV